MSITWAQLLKRVVFNVLVSVEVEISKPCRKPITLLLAIVHPSLSDFFTPAISFKRKEESCQGQQLFLPPFWQVGDVPVVGEPHECLRLGCTEISQAFQSIVGKIFH
ncbi:expressed unknown protein [Seminavis robusta]|uniref:Uncharacterized protein n=1 Tax=Seminavis robusta TaxID=568900 RepID=A0A9N8E153_9STRA|nr:expressed unknown protein [Seminavis robusta]|eukprot:Sro544_g163623.1  (107) ;mRNA; f:8052-8372